MIDLKNRLRRTIDTLLVGLLILLLFGSSLAFGGSTWWARAAIAATISALAILLSLRVLVDGKLTISLDPPSLLGLVAIGLGIVQLLPLPAPIAERLSPRSRELHTLGAFPELVRSDDPQAVLTQAAEGRSPVAIDRSATVRGLGAATGCLLLFVVAARFADRLGRLLVIWGCVVASCAVHAMFGLVQFVGGTRSLYGLFEPGKGPPWAPNLEDALRAPAASALRSFGDGPIAWALPTVDRGFPIGGLVGGPAAFRTLAGLALPLALAILLQHHGSRGSRLGLRDRVRESGQGGLIVALSLATLAIAIVLGMISGALLCVPAAIGIAAVGLIGGWKSGFRWGSLGLTVALVSSMFGGVALGDSLGRPADVATLAERADRDEVATVWKLSAQVAGDFPVLGVGLGGLPTILSFVKHTDHLPTSALSTLPRWSAEMGLAGTIPLALAALWCVIRLPRAVRRVGPADRPLAAGLLGALVAFTLYSLIQTTVETPSIALAAAAVLGNLDRWVAGGTDLFVQG